MNPKLSGSRVRSIAYKRLGPPGYEHCTWEGMNSPDRVAEVVATQTAKHITAPRFPIYIYGPAGTGKSGIASVLFRIATSAIWRRADTLLLDLSTGRSDGKYTQEIKKIETTHVLVLDDLGLRKPSEGMFHMLFDILERRKAKMTVITSNHSPEQLRDVVFEDERIFSRLLAGTTLACDGEDRRKVDPVRYKV
jgi:DNA replication protein DnaC